jgi:hypothetical protein
MMSTVFWADRIAGARLAFASSLLLACSGEGPISQSNTSDGEAASSEASGESGETGMQDLVDGPLEFQVYEAQPMVVDVIVRLSAEADFLGADEALWSHDSDAGVRFVWLSGSDDGLEHHFRIRGLAPDSSHGVTVELAVGDESASVEGEFETAAALPGFEASVVAQGVSTNPDSYRLFDWSSIGDRPGGVMQIDAQGQTRWYWGKEFATGTGAVIEGLKLLSDGSVLYTLADRLLVRTELNELSQQIVAADYGLPYFHHEALRLPNGNLMTLGREFEVVSYPDDGDLLIAGDTILEFEPGGELVWSWSSLAHLDVQRRREGFDALAPAIFEPVSGQQAKDWTHGNGITYSPESDTLLLSLRHQDWLIEIDHASGDVLWKLGEEGDFVLEEGSWFYHQHSAQWQADGSLLLYDNGNGNPDIAADAYASRAVRYELDFDTMVARQLWEDDMEDFRSPAMGDADSMSDGNYLVTDSTLGLDEGAPAFYSRVRELDPGASPQLLWEFSTEPGRVIYRALPVDRLVGEPLATLP